MSQSKIDFLITTALNQLGVMDLSPFKVEVPPRKELGDYATNAAILHAKKLGQNPLVLAEKMSGLIKQSDQAGLIREITIAKPGFINIFLNDRYIQQTVLTIEKQAEKWGWSQLPVKQRILLEFVSANPTGPLHVGHGRWAVVGDIIANILSAAGYDVTKEFYVNNIGNQVEKLWQSILAVRDNRPVPESGYGGSYIKEIQGNTLEETLDFLLTEQKATLRQLGANFDSYFFENVLHEAGKVKAAVARLTELGKTFEESGAIWFKAMEMGDDKNRVLIREDGRPTDL